MNAEVGGWFFFITLLSHLDVVTDFEFSTSFVPLTVHFIMWDLTDECSTLLLHHLHILQFLDYFDFSGCRETIWGVTVPLIIVTDWFVHLMTRVMFTMNTELGRGVIISAATHVSACIVRGASADDQSALSAQGMDADVFPGFQFHVIL